jgi:hypothetical protein
MLLYRIMKIDLLVSLESLVLNVTYHTEFLSCTFLTGRAGNWEVDGKRQRSFGIYIIVMKLEMAFLSSKFSEPFTRTIVNSSC